MKAIAKVNGVEYQLEGDTSDIIDVMNKTSEARQKAAATVVEAPAKRSYVRRATKSNQPWTERELMTIVGFVKSTDINKYGLANRTAKELSRQFDRTELAVYNASSRIIQFLQGNPDGRKHLSKRMLKVLAKNNVMPVSEESTGFLGRVNNQGVGVVPVQEA